MKAFTIFTGILAVIVGMIGIIAASADWAAIVLVIGIALQIVSIFIPYSQSKPKPDPTYNWLEFYSRNHGNMCIWMGVEYLDSICYKTACHNKFESRGAAPYGICPYCQRQMLHISEDEVRTYFYQKGGNLNY